MIPVTNENGEEGLIVTQMLRQIVEGYIEDQNVGALEKVKKQLSDDYDMIIKMKADLGDNYILGCYEYIDELIAQLLKKDNEINHREPSSCKRGCAWCCGINVDASDIEFKPIEQYLKLNPGFKIDYEKINRLAALNDIADWKQYKFADRSCVFLNDKQECSIYDIRPMACRKYYVATPPIKCSWTEDNQVGVIAFTPVETFVSALYIVLGKAEPLVKLLKNYGEKENTTT